MRGMENNEKTLFYLKNSNEVNNLRVSLNHNFSHHGIIFSKTDIKEVIHSRNMLLKEQELIDFSLMNTERIMLLSMKYSPENKKELVQTCLDLLEIFYYVKSVHQHLYSDEEVINMIEEAMDMNEAEIESVRGYFEDQI